MTKITAGPPHPSRYTAVDIPQDDAELVAKVRQLTAGLSSDNADLLAAFHRIQHEYGYVPREAIPVLASQFRTTPSMLYGALDFYSEIRTVPPARTTVEWCSGPACLLKGSANIRRVLEVVLGCEMNGNSDDGAFGLRLAQCDGTCHVAPQVRLHDRYIGPLSVSDAVTLARELTGERSPAPARPAEGGAEQTWRPVEEPRRTLIKIGLTTCSRAVGATETLDAVRKELNGSGLDAEVMVTGCWGLCYAEPIVEVVRPGQPPVLYGRVTADKAPQFVEQAVSARGVATDLALAVLADEALQGVPPLRAP